MVTETGWRVYPLVGVKSSHGELITLKLTKGLGPAIFMGPTELQTSTTKGTTTLNFIISQKNMLPNATYTVSSTRSGYKNSALADGISGIPFSFDTTIQTTPESPHNIVVQHPGAFDIIALVGIRETFSQSEAPYLQFSIDGQFQASQSTDLVFPVMEWSTYLLLSTPNTFPFIRVVFPKALTFGELWIGTQTKLKRMYLAGINRDEKIIGRVLESEYGVVNFNYLSRRLSFQLPFIIDDSDRTTLRDVHLNTQGKYFLAVLEQQECYLVRLTDTVRFQHERGDIWRTTLEIETEPMP